MASLQQRKPLYLSWSSGKDSAWALHQLRQSEQYEVVGLLTTINQVAERVAMHAVRERLLDLQAEALGLPLHKVYIPSPCSHEQYADAMSKAVQALEAQGIRHMAFGDLFLEDVRQYREDRMRDTALTPVFPLWGLDTVALSQEMTVSGLRAVITSVDPNKLDPAFAGRIYDAEFLKALPPGVDPCGEYGEFHSFAFAGPMFNTALEVTLGEVVTRDGFVFADVTPTE